MAKKKNKELEERLAKAEEGMANLQAMLRSAMTLAVTYFPNGAILDVAVSSPGGVASLKATKAVLQTLIMNVDNQLLKAVEEEAKSQNQPSGQ